MMLGLKDEVPRFLVKKYSKLARENKGILSLKDNEKGEQVWYWVADKAKGNN